ncbi:MAG TPA: hypothetical protein VIQ02_06365 [Jiangellaceae bacterium]
MSKTTGRICAGALLMALAIGISSSGAATFGGPHRKREDIDLLSSAHPGPPNPDVSDAAVDTKGQSHARQVKADASAVATATCDGCTGDATTLQVLVVRRAEAAYVDNVATAWSSCVDCGAISLSVQVILLYKSPMLTANNRASAVNAGCEQCTSTAVAYQLVVETDSPRGLSRAEREALEAWVEEQAALLRAGEPAAEQQRTAATTWSADSTLEELDDLVEGPTVERDVDRQSS